MSRSQRLLDLLQLLRRHRRPVTGEVIAAELGVSLRTLYRDVATLQAQGLHVDGAPGLGYVLRPGTVLPPLSFTSDEIEALALGFRWVASRGDVGLRAAASDALAKIAAVVPPDRRRELDTAALLVGPSDTKTPDEPFLPLLRQAIRREHKLVIRYRAAGAAETTRTVWPFALGHFDRVRVVVAWCERRAAVRHFRSDRIVALEGTGCRFPERREALLARWRQQQGIAEPD